MLGLPRGGVAVAAPVARALGAPLGVLVVRKLGAPRQPELGFGALAEGPTRVLNQALVAELGLSPGEVDAIAAREQAELDRRVRRYRGDGPPPDVRGREVVLVDDGIATGATVRAAIEVLRAQGAGRVVVAAPVAAGEVAAELAELADDVVVLLRPDRFFAIGLWYQDFEQVPDAQVVRLLVEGGAMTDVRVEPGLKRVRVYLGGQVVADTLHPLLVWENANYPAYYVPADDVRATLAPTGAVEPSPRLGDATVYDVTTATATARGAARRYLATPALAGAVRLAWDAMDEWLEEDEPVYTHPRDPHKRVDILASSRHVQVARDGVVLADSRQPRILFETDLPPRYYLPLTDVRMDLLRPSDKVTHCPYKGAANYYSVVVGDQIHPDLVWMYRAPLPESQKIAGLVCFFNERVDLTIDGVAVERPRTPFS